MSHGASGGNKRSLPNSALGSSKRQNINIFPPHGKDFFASLAQNLAVMCHSMLKTKPLMLRTRLLQFEFGQSTSFACCITCTGLIAPATSHINELLIGNLSGFPGGAFAPDLVHQSQHLFGSHQGDSLRELASVAVDHPMASEGLVDASAAGMSDLCMF